MQPISSTPAENLLQCLLNSENLENAYSYSIEKNETHTNITLLVNTIELNHSLQKSHE